MRAWLACVAPLLGLQAASLEVASVNGVLAGSSDAGSLSAVLRTREARYVSVVGWEGGGVTGWRAERPFRLHAVAGADAWARFMLGGSEDPEVRDLVVTAGESPLEVWTHNMQAWWGPVHAWSSRVINESVTKAKQTLTKAVPVKGVPALGVPPRDKLLKAAAASPAAGASKARPSLDALKGWLTGPAPAPGHAATWTMPHPWYVRVLRVTPTERATFIYVDTARALAALEAEDFEAPCWEALERALALAPLFSAHIVVFGAQPLMSSAGGSPALAFWLLPLLRRARVDMYVSSAKGATELLHAHGITQLVLGGGDPPRPQRAPGSLWRAQRPHVAVHNFTTAGMTTTLIDTAGKAAHTHAHKRQRRPDLLPQHADIFISSLPRGGQIVTAAVRRGAPKVLALLGWVLGAGFTYLSVLVLFKRKCT